MSYTSTTGIFVRSTTDPVINMYRMWVLEDINYRVGDVNMDGVVNVNDATYLQELLVTQSGAASLSNIKFYLADANRNGVVNISDTTTIQKIAAGLLYY